MGIRKNAKYLSLTEKENFVWACVMMKADIVNPGAPPANRYSRWDEYVALHRMIQNAFAPGAAAVNFGHGGGGAYSFFSWHRYFLIEFEKQLQSHVPGVMLPYWDWTDPSPIMTNTFLGPDGGAGSIVSSGYFAASAPGTGGNPTPSPGWWPASLTGWNLHSAFGLSWQGPLRRNLSGVSGLPTVADLQQALGKTTYPALKGAVESGTGISSSHQMHNGLHGWVGGHMSNPTASPFDPIFYLHHCNIDRLWAMWQMDGHANVYPNSGGFIHHHRTDIMYPWTGGAAGYGTNVNLSPIAMPDFSALGAKTNEDTLDHRALGYTYDTLAIVGISLDRTGSMNQTTPDPMTIAAPDVTKWVAATRGVSAFFQDCEAAYSSKEAYVFAGVETFRSVGASNQFNSVFAGPASGLVKSGGAYSRSVFDSNVASMTPGGGTPLADALTHADTALVKAPFGDLPADERRYLAILTDGKRTTGSTIASIPNGSLGDTAVFAMGFGTGADVDYATLDQLVTKGTVLPITQVFHGENAGTIDKFYTNSLAAAIGYVPVVDPLIELFAGEHTHLDFYATSAEDSFFISAQGMDFEDPNWTFHLKAPDGSIVHGGAGHSGHGQSMHCCHPLPTVNFVRGNARLSLFLQRGGAPAQCWVGRWELMAAYKARDMSRMMMMPVGALIAPVSAGPLRGPRYARPQTRRKTRSAARSVVAANRHALDLMVAAPPDTNDACNLLVGIYARTRLNVHMHAFVGNGLSFKLHPEASSGMVSKFDAYGRLFSPRVDMSKAFDDLDPRIARGARLRGSKALKFDSGKVLSKLEAADPKRFAFADEVLPFKSNDEGGAAAQVERADVPGVYHLGVMVEGVYHPQGEPGRGDYGHGAHSGAKSGEGERFTRVISASIAVHRG